MKTTNTVVLLLIAVAVIAAIYFQKKGSDTAVGTAAIPEKTIPAVTSGTLERIVISAPDQPEVELTRVDETWYVDAERKFEADATPIRAAITAVSEPIQATVVSTNPDNFAEYQLTDTTATKVRMYDTGEDKPALALLIGKDGPSAFTTYVRLPGTQEVLNAKASLSMAFKRPDGWRKRAIFAFPAGNVTRIEQKGSSATYTLVKHEDDWKVEEPETADAESAPVSAITNMLSNLHATDFVDIDSTKTLADLGLEPVRQTVVLHYEDKATSPSRETSATLLIGNRAEVNEDSPASMSGAGWYAKRADKPDIFTIGNSVAESLSPALDKVKIEPPPPPPADDATTGTATSEIMTTGTMTE